MKLLRAKLTFANVVACLALFIALGGVSYAALQLPKNSVGPKQLKRNAVTPAKLSPAAKRALIGSTGPAGPQGKEGPAGPQGPGAVTIDVPAPEAQTVVATFNGIQVKPICQPTSVQIGLNTVGDTGTLRVSGTSNNYNAGEDVVPIDLSGAASGTSVSGVASPYQVSLNVIARNTAASKVFGRFDLHLDAASCVLWGVYTPSVVS
jgi:hypothetical protein